MWQHQYEIHRMRMAELHAAADRERRWRMEDAANGRASAASSPGRGRVIAARTVAALSRGGARVARRLDPRVSVELGSERLLRDA
ncbi:MAG: hypothetical protein MUE92_03980 [Chloroflexi bacterium]|jgi:hypothetical protein|nr:hypothetical protein [Chloroflexota bacterium]